MPTIQQLVQQGHGFAIFPEIRIFDKPTKGKSIQHLLFGDYITPPKDKKGNYLKWSDKTLVKGSGDKTMIKVRSRQTEGWIRLSEIQLERTLEVNFVDIGQGDGCHLVTPSDDHFIIDAGEKDHMYEFLRWRFNLDKKGGKLPDFTAIMSHPDQDHWKGFEPLLSKIPKGQVRQILFDKLYYNGILQRRGSKIGKTIQKNGRHYLKEFIVKDTDLRKVLKKTGEKSKLEAMLIGAMKNFPALQFETTFKKMGEENLIYKKKKLRLEILAPIPEDIDGQLMLRWFDEKLKDIGKTKNGHSVVVCAEIGKMRILLGGDLNAESADYLMSTYGEDDLKALRIQLEQATDADRPALQARMDTLMRKCKKVFASEIAKSCHHGSSDITNELLAAMNPICTVISSGDEEPHFHPRPETLGAIGKFGRGNRPLIFSTELGRSTPDYIELKLDKTKTGKQKQKVVATYGTVMVRTDGTNAVIAQKLERSRSSYGLLTKWHVDKIIWNDERQEFISRKELREEVKKVEG